MMERKSLQIANMQLSQADPKTLLPNPFNPNVVTPENEEKLSASVDRLSMFKPILVRTLESGRLEILGGHHRNVIAIRKGFESVPILNLGKISDDKAKEIALIDNSRYGADDSQKLSEILSELGSPEELATFMPFSQVDFESIFSSTSIELEDLGIEDDEEPTHIEFPTLPKIQTHQVMRFKVPSEDAARVSEVLERIMKTQGFTEQDSLTNAGDALVWLITNAVETEDGQV
ncbi:ParB/RepB/Spo0J family partition protein [Ectothiorhodospira shaposhnikovii]|uniref:ParB/RepB/Spo0J family partition protein n=1 Tax=Ectothiorhodospira shaposhnikovii TaxID=1054 RepID=UPI001EE8C806|nr:ParB/RepB/Spo0J family partition protein [Ectothiorhodospira shaposhnikovii]MCG5512840.1 ParB/RepB/Spo0J family partition protein [Ectothiorhodospira shaposhnikovii]